MEHEDVLHVEDAPGSRRFSPTVTATLWGLVLALSLLLVMVAVDVEMPDAKTAAKNTLSAVLGVLIVLAALTLIALAVLRRSVLFAALGLIVLLGGVGMLATTLGLPESMQGTTSAIDSLFGLLGQLLDFLGRLLEWKQ